MAALAARGIGALRAAGFEVLTPEDAHGGIVSLRHPRASDLVRALAGQAILVEDAAPIVRASAHFYNSDDDIDRFASALVGSLRTAGASRATGRLDPAGWP